MIGFLLRNGDAKASLRKVAIKSYDLEQLDDSQRWMGGWEGLASSTGGKKHQQHQQQQQEEQQEEEQDEEEE